MYFFLVFLPVSAGCNVQLTITKHKPDKVRLVKHAWHYGSRH